MGVEKLEKELLERRLEEIVVEAYHYKDGFTYGSVIDAVKKAFELGKHRTPKKVDDNPYHIDHKRQTKLEL